MRPVSEPYVAFRYKIWAETLETTSAEPIFTYVDGLLADKIAITRHHIGQGEVIYLGCWPQNFSDVAKSQGWIPPVRQSVRMATLDGDDGSHWQVVMNHREYPVEQLGAYDARYERIDDDRA
jgi:hypothetical protein